MRIGIISDTHDRILASLFTALAGVDEILHAGDITRTTALVELGAIAPVTAVRGNCDEPALADRLPAERLIERGGVSIAMIHGHVLGRELVADLMAKYRVLAPDLVVFGHTHEPYSKLVGPTRYLNPGTAGGVGGPASAAILEAASGRYAIETIALR